VLADLVVSPEALEGGMSFHGGFLGVLAAVALFARQGGRRVWMSPISPHRSPASAYSRCASAISINGELWGKPTDGWWGMRVS